ncbi:MAG: hypothetical protein ACI3VR_04020 [Intestinibacter sp.]|uniref:hypothetical protein n=1 Tax=Intestinibacter sp. TaxID=1965304 RepID=UPI003F169A4B
MKEKINQLNRTAFIVAFIHWCIGFFTDGLFFNLNVLGRDLYSTGIFVLLKILYLVLLVCVWQILFNTIKKIRNKDERVINYLKISAVYFFIMTCFLILTWPGVWRANEFVIINNVVNFHIDIWQNYLTSMFYILCLMLMPFVSGIIIIQNLCISLIVGYVIYKIYYYTDKSKFSFFMYIPFLMLPIIDQNLYPIRNSIYGYLELLFLFKILFLKYENAKLNQKDICIFAILIAILSTWRSEGIYYFVLGTIVVFITFNKSFNKKCKSTFLVMTLIFTVVLFLPQKIFISGAFGDKYDISSIISPLHNVVKSEVEKYKDEYDINQIIDSNKDLNNIDKVLDVEVLVKNKNGLDAYWGKQPLIKKGYSSQDYSRFKKSYVSLVKNNINVFMDERKEVFLKTSALRNWNIFVGNTSNLYSKKYSTTKKYDVFRESMYTEPINKNLREKTILFLECGEGDFKPNSYFKYAYNLFPAVIGLALIAIITLLSKKYTLLMISLLALVRIPLVFMTAPRALFMYYFSPYLIGTVLMFLIIWAFLYNQFLYKRKNKTNMKIEV